MVTQCSGIHKGKHSKHNYLLVSMHTISRNSSSCITCNYQFPKHQWLVHNA